jgi:hypothetical protein
MSFYELTTIEPSTKTRYDFKECYIVYVAYAPKSCAISSHDTRPMIKVIAEIHLLEAVACKTNPCHRAAVRSPELRDLRSVLSPSPGTRLDDCAPLFCSRLVGKRALLVATNSRTATNRYTTIVAATTGSDAAIIRARTGETGRGATEERLGLRARCGTA